MYVWTVARHPAAPPPYLPCSALRCRPSPCCGQRGSSPWAWSARVQQQVRAAAAAAAQPLTACAGETSDAGLSGHLLEQGHQADVPTRPPGAKCGTVDGARVAKVHGQPALRALDPPVGLLRVWGSLRLPGGLQERACQRLGGPQGLVAHWLVAQVGDSFAKDAAVLLGHLLGDACSAAQRERTRLGDWHGAADWEGSLQSSSTSSARCAWHGQRRSCAAGLPSSRQASQAGPGCVWTAALQTGAPLLVAGRTRPAVRANWERARGRTRLCAAASGLEIRGTSRGLHSGGGLPAAAAMPMGLFLACLLGILRGALRCTAGRAPCAGAARPCLCQLVGLLRGLAGLWSALMHGRPASQDVGPVALASAGAKVQAGRQGAALPGASCAMPSSTGCPFWKLHLAWAPLIWRAAAS